MLLDIAGPAEVLRRANIEQSGVRFEVNYHAAGPCILSSVGLTLSELQPLPAELPDDAVVLVSGTTDSLMLPDRDITTMPDTAHESKRIVQWLKSAVRPAHLLVCIHSGALLAARAGLLDGHVCTAHHADCEALVRLAPGARVIENQLYVEDRNRLTSAGIAAGIDLMLHLIGRYTDPFCVVRVARALVVHRRRAGNESQSSPWFAGRNHIHHAVHKAQDAVAAAPAASWSLASLAVIANASTRHLSRLFKAHAGMSVPEYVGQLRIALANEFLRNTSLDLERVAELSGFASTRQLRRTWSRYYTHPPSQVRRLPRGRGVAALA